jgi:hypothetical protein
VVAFWIAVIGVIVVLLRAAAGRPEGASWQSALGVLEERYAARLLVKSSSSGARS